MNTEIENARITEDGAILHGVERTKNGRITGKFMVYANVVIDGKRYSARRFIRAQFSKDKPI